MVTGHAYEQVCAWFAGVDFEQHGCYVQGVHEYLAEHGFALQTKHRYLGYFRNQGKVSGSVERVPWLCEPFAQRHIAQVLVYEMAPCDHFVVMTDRGVVLDPLCDEPKSLADYYRVNQVSGVWRVATEVLP